MIWIRRLIGTRKDPLDEPNIVFTLLLVSLHVMLSNYSGAASILTTVLMWDMVRIMGITQPPKVSLYFLWIAGQGGAASMIYNIVMALTTIHGTVYTQESPKWNTPEAAVLLGSKYDLVFKGPADPNTPVIAEYEARDLVREDLDALKTLLGYKLISTLLIVVLAGYASAGFRAEGLSIGVLMAATFYFLYKLQGKHGISSTPSQRAPGRYLPGETGIYSVEMRCLVGSIKVGVGYLANGTFTTRLHVTHGLPINMGGNDIKPCYINRKADVVSYGKPPQIGCIQQGDRVTVMLAGPYSDAIIPYRTVALLSRDGEVYFDGNISMEGTSGSPIFRAKDEDGRLEWEYVGCTGWKAPIANDHIQVATAITDATSPQGELQDKSVVQHFSSPGSGKTRNVLPGLTIQGLMKYGRVYVTGPTKAVATEAYKALKEQDEIAGKISLQISGTSSNVQKHAPVIVMAHQTALSMILSGEQMVSKPGLWIMDEAHFNNTGSQCLKHLLRHRVKERGGTLYEMTATGYDITDKVYTYCDGSNYHINDMVMTKDEMLDKLRQEDRKVVVFITADRGKDSTTAESIFNSLKTSSKDVISLNRKTFDANYLKAVEMEKGYILTTDISECGANFNADVVYDFQETPKPITYTQGECRIVKRVITRGQAIQRRGRVGRRKPGDYISIRDHRFLLDDDNFRAENLDVAIFLKAMDIKAEDPQHKIEVDPQWRLTLEQVRAWLGEGMQALSDSPYMIKIYTNGDGRKKSTDQMRESIRLWAQGPVDVVTSKREDKHIGVQCWDERDNSGFYSLARAAGLISEEEVPRHIKPSDVFDKLYRMIPIRKAPKAPPPSISSSSDITEEEEQDE